MRSRGARAFGGCPCATRARRRPRARAHSARSRPPARTDAGRRDHVKTDRSRLSLGVEERSECDAFGIARVGPLLLGVEERSRDAAFAGENAHGLRGFALLERLRCELPRVDRECGLVVRGVGCVQRGAERGVAQLETLGLERGRGPVGDRDAALERVQHHAVRQTQHHPHRLDTARVSEGPDGRSKRTKLHRLAQKQDT